MPRPELLSAWLRTNGIHILSFQQIAGRAASATGVDADLRRVLCRALNGSARPDITTLRAGQPALGDQRSLAILIT